MNSHYKIISCEKFNANDNSYKLVELYFANGDLIRKGEVVLALDTSKASYDLTTNFEGYFFSPYKLGDIVTANRPLFVVLDEFDPDKIKEYESLFFHQQAAGDSATVNNNNNHEGSKIVTEKAKRLITEFKLELNAFSENLITENVVNSYLKNLQAPSKKSSIVLPNPNYNRRRRIAVIGAGKSFIQLFDILSSLNITPVFIYDDAEDKIGQSIYNVPIKDKVNYEIIKHDFSNDLFDGLAIAVSGSIEFRKRVFNDLNSLGVPFQNLIHPTSYIGVDCVLGMGNIILPFVSVGPCTAIGNNNFISARSNIEHHNSLGSHCTFGPGVMTSGSVTIEDEVKFGTGIFIEPRLRIGGRSIISSGCIITRDITEESIVFSKGNEIILKKR